MACPNLDTCPMYAEFRVQALLTVWKVQYCEGEYARCERYVMKARGDEVPPTLLPDGATMHARRRAKSA